jgi:hypothetical protein
MAFYLILFIIYAPDHSPRILLQTAGFPVRLPEEIHPFLSEKYKWIS